jgi:hypothetical protein
VAPPNCEDRAANSPVSVRIPDVAPPEEEDRRDNCYWVHILRVLVDDMDHVVLEKWAEGHRIERERILDLYLLDSFGRCVQRWIL